MAQTDVRWQKIKNITANVPHIAEGGELEIQTFKLKKMYNRSKTVHLNTKPPLLAICCYVPFSSQILIK